MISKMNYKSFLRIRQKQLALARVAVGTKKINQDELPEQEYR